MAATSAVPGDDLASTPGPRTPGESTPAMGPDSVSARYFGDVRLLAVAPRTLTLQVAHPVVGAGVEQHSDFVGDPWGRLDRTLDTVVPLVYGTPARARQLGEALRRSHRGIVGTDDQGRRYSALDPEAYFWVHATLFDGVLTASRTFGPRIPEQDLPRLYEEFRVGADLLQCDPSQVPATFADFRDWFRTMLEERLEHTQASRDVARVVRQPVPPPQLPSSMQRLWPVAWAPIGQVMRVTHRTLLPSTLRRRWGIQVSAAEWAEARLVIGAVRAGFRAIPASRRELPQVRRERARTRRALAGVET